MINETALLRLMNTPGLGAKTLLRLLKRLAFENYPVSDFVSAPASELIHEFKLKPEMVSFIKSENNEADMQFAELQEHEIQILFVGHSKYPDKLLNALRDDAPPIIFAKGNLDILSMKSVGFCGSRDVSESGQRATQASSSALAEKDINIVSGYAQGVDTLAHRAALKANGHTTVVLATGILQFNLKSDLFDFFDEDKFLVISEFPARLGWLARNAMLRNKTICGLSDVMLLIESGLKGGTFEAGKTALELQIPLFVVNYEESDVTPEGNRYFLRNGAKPLDFNKDYKPILEPILESLDNKKADPQQTSLFE